MPLMSMPISSLLRRLQQEMDHSPDSSPQWRSRGILALQRGMDRLLRDAPFLAREETISAILRKNTESLNGTDNLAVTSDSWVLQRTKTAIAVAAGEGTEWNVKNTDHWTGRTLVVRDLDSPDSRSLRFLIREVWDEGNPGDPDDPQPIRTYVSLDRPFPNTTSTRLEYRIYDKSVVLPVEVSQVKSISLTDELRKPLEACTTLQHEEFYLAQESFTSRTTGTPTRFHRGQVARLDAPYQAPSVAEDPDNPWVGPEPQGEFMYAMSIVFGKQEVWLHHGNPMTQTILAPDVSRHRPWMESALGPESSKISTTGSGIALEFPSWDFLSGFGLAGPLRETHSGFRIRIYRRRFSVTGTATKFAHDSRFYLIAEVDGHTRYWTDTGANTPDIRTPSPVVGGVQRSLSFWPLGDKDYELRIRAAIRPPRLVSEAQVPQVEPEALDPLVYAAKGYMLEAAGKTSQATSAFKDYQRALDGVKRRLATDIPPGQLIEIGFGRSSARSRMGQNRGPGLNPPFHTTLK